MKLLNFIRLIFALPRLSSYKEISSLGKKTSNKIVEFTVDELEKYNFGCYLIKNDTDVYKNPDFAATVCWKLVWQLRYIKEVNSKLLQKVHLPKYGMCNFLTDGWTHWIGDTKEDVIEHLNNNEHGTKFRFLTKEELFYIISNRSNQKQIVRNLNQ